MSGAPGSIEVHRAASIGGRCRVPGDKSISHRALMFSAVARGQSIVNGLSKGQDVVSTANVLRTLGVAIDWRPGETATIDGCGFSGFRQPVASLDCGNSGTTMRLMMGLLAGTGIDATLVGDDSLSSRPMARVAEPLSLMGARVALGEDGRPPVHVTGAELRAITYRPPVASAQIKSALVLAGLQADGTTIIEEPGPSRDHTERLLSQMGAEVTTSDNRVIVRRSALVPLKQFEVPGDFSSAAYFLAAGLLLPGPGMTIDSVGLNPTRMGFWDVVKSMGGDLEMNQQSNYGEPAGTVTARRSVLSPFEIGGDLLVRAIDEVPILAVLASQAKGRSIISEASELRVKESDRLASTALMLNAMGGRVRETDDGLIIDGPTPLHPAIVDCKGDHRIAMSAAIAALVAEPNRGTTIVRGADSAAISYPSFFADLDSVTSNVIGEVW